MTPTETASTALDGCSGGGGAVSCLYAPRPVPVLAARLSDEPRPSWLEALVHAGRLWTDRRGWHAGSGEDRVDLDPGGFIILNGNGELRTCHPLPFRTLFEPYEPAPHTTGVGGDPLGTDIREWQDHHLRWLQMELPDDVPLDKATLHALRPIPVLASTLSRTPRPGWLERLEREGRLRSSRGNGSVLYGGSRTEIDPNDHLTIDASGRIEVFSEDAFPGLFMPYEPSTHEVSGGDVFLNVAYHEGDTRFATGYVSGWGGLRWLLSVDGTGEGNLTVFGRYVDEDDGPQDAWAIETSLDAKLAERALGTDGSCVRSESQREIACIIAGALSRMDVSIVCGALLEELQTTAPLPKGKRRRSR